MLKGIKDRVVNQIKATNMLASAAETEEVENDIVDTLLAENKTLKSHLQKLLKEKEGLEAKAASSAAELFQKEELVESLRLQLHMQKNSAQINALRRDLD